PRPRARTEIIHDGYAEHPGFGGELEIKTGKVDGHEDVRPLFLQKQGKLLLDAPEGPDALQRLGETDDALAGYIVQDVDSRFGHEAAAHAEKAYAGAEPQDLPDEVAAVQVARRLSGHDHDAQDAPPSSKPDSTATKLTPAPSATSCIFSLSTRIVRCASKANTRTPHSAMVRTVSGPTVGRSKRGSWSGLATLQATTS